MGRLIIDSFVDDYRFLSNFYPSRIEYEGIIYSTVEHAFQATKSLHVDIRKYIASLPTPGKAKQFGRQVVLRPEWDQIKIQVMFDLVMLKFKDPVLLKKLLETEDAELIEGNTWKDTFWGIYRGKGKNFLGRILMRVRSHFQKN